MQNTVVKALMRLITSREAERVSIPAKLSRLAVELEDTANTAATAGQTGEVCDQLRLAADQVRRIGRDWRT